MSATLASLFSLTVLGTFLLVVSGLVFYFGGLHDAVGLAGLIALEAALFILVWLIKPWMSDAIYKWFYGLHWITFHELRSLDAPLATFIQGICDRRNIDLPRIGIIEDDNPQAFTYGSDHWNARMVFTRGIFGYLDEKERKAVAAHELGHIVRRDFIIMTLAAFFLTVLYVIGRVLIRTRGRKNPLPVIGMASLAFYYVGSYLLLFLSRAREYLADDFAKHECGNGNDLSTVLVKIAYGLVTARDTGKTRELMEGTRTLGIFDHKAAKTFGLVGTDFIKNADSNAVTNAMVYDTHSLWAFWLELGSSHPLTGKRIRALLAGEKQPVFDLAAVDAFAFDHSRHLREFIVDWTLSNLWLIGLLACAAAYAARVLPSGVILVVTGLGLIIRALYRYPSSTPAPATIDELMSDPYASPVRGKRCALEGKLVGRGTPGFVFSEDFMFEDRTGLLFLDYQYWLPVLGNLIFAVKRAGTFVGKSASCDGWFFRGFSQHLTLNAMRCENEVIKSSQKDLALVGAVLVIVAGGMMWVFGDPVPLLFS